MTLMTTFQKPPPLSLSILNFHQAVFDHLLVGRQPSNRAELLFCEPTCSLVLKQRKTAVHHLTKEAMHG